MRQEGIKKGRIMGTPLELQNFLRRNSDAWQLASKASDDYLLARLGLQNAMWSGFEMATQATEKLLKAYLLFVDQTLKGTAENVRKAVGKASRSRGRNHEVGHDVEACLALAADVGLPASTDLQSRLARINHYYEGRYPGCGGPASLSTSELQDVDDAVFSVWDAFESINADYHLVCGIMSPVYGRIMDFRNNSAEPESLPDDFSIMTANNKAFESRRSRIEEQIFLRLDAWYPRP